MGAGFGGKQAQPFRMGTLYPSILRTCEIKASEETAGQHRELTTRETYPGITNSSFEDLFLS
jgi:hypothetical protein